jgi:hypothetical protein
VTHRRGFKPGVYPDLSLTEYLAICDEDGWPAISSTLIRNMRHGPRECWHRQKFATEVTPSMLAGRLAHIQILEPQRYLEDVVEWREPVLEPLPALQWDKVAPTRYQTQCDQYYLARTGGIWQPIVQSDGLCLGEHSTVPAAKKACKEHYEAHAPRQPKLDADGHPKLQPQNKNNHAYQEFLAANPGREVVTRSDLEQARRIAEAVRDNPEARRRLGQIWRTEYTIVWEHESGALLKVRLDWLTDPNRQGQTVTIGELKTCRSAAEAAFNRQAADMEYHVQAALYVAGFRAIWGMRPESIVLAVENGGSHDSTVYPWERPELDAGAEVAEERIQQILEYRERYRTRPWPCRQPVGRLSFEEHGRGYLLGGDDDGPALDWNRGGDDGNRS